MTEGSMSDLLSRRMLAHQLDKGEIARIEPIVFETFKSSVRRVKAEKNASWGSQMISPTWPGTLTAPTQQA
jgi:hypothetical protein